MTRILVATPVRVPFPAALWRSLETVHRTLRQGNPSLVLDFAVHRNRPLVAHNADPCTGHARARNELLDHYLRPDHQYLLWLDADIVAVPADLPQRLLAAAPQPAIVAPVVLIEGMPRFYDTQGFRTLDGERVLPNWVPGAQDASPVPLSEVGTCYLVPAVLYREGTRYATTPGHTEHASVMREAAARGWPIWCDPTTTIAHANLPRYGRAWHVATEVPA